MFLSSSDSLLGLSFFWRVSFSFLKILSISQDFYRCKETLQEENISVCSFYSPYPLEHLHNITALLFTPLWLIWPGSFSQASALRKPWLGRVSCCPSVLILYQAFPPHLEFFCTSNLKTFLLPGKIFFSLLLASFQTQCVCRCSFAPLICVLAGLIKGKNTHYSSMPVCTLDICNLKMCWARPCPGKQWDEICMFGAEDGKDLPYTSNTARCNEDLLTNSELKETQTPLHLGFFIWICP